MGGIAAITSAWVLSDNAAGRFFSHLLDLEIAEFVYMKNADLARRDFVLAFKCVALHVSFPGVRLDLFDDDRLAAFVGDVNFDGHRFAPMARQ